MRVLHLFDHSALSRPYAKLALLAQSIGRLPGVDQDICLLGNRTLERTARELGLEARWLISAPGRHAALGCFAARGRLKARSYDLIHCWSGDALGSATLATLLAPGVPRVVTVSSLPTVRQTHWARMLAGERHARTTYLATSATICRELRSHGVSEQATHVLRPGLDFGLIDRQRRDEIRARWPVTPDTTVVGLVADPIESTHAVAAHMAIGLANEGLRLENKPVSIVVHSQQFDRLQAVKVARHLGRAEVVVVDDRIACPWEVLPACDIAMAMGEQTGSLGLLWAMAAGVPIIGEARYAVSEIVEDRHSALLAKPGIPRLLSHRITQLIHDPQLAWKLKDTARHEAYSLFSRQRYVQSLGQVYQQVAAGEAVSIPEMEATGGLRFAGRA